MSEKNEVMCKLPKISIVTISYNQVNFLSSCVESVLNQNYGNLEYIIVDAESSDGSIDYIKSINNPIVDHIIEKDAGPADGLNKGFSKATGDIFYFLNADDVLHKDALINAIRYFKDDPSLMVLFGGGVIIDENGMPKKRILPSRFDRELLVNGGVTFFQQGIFFRREVFNESKFNVDNRVCWDTEFLFDATRNPIKTRRIFTPLASFRVYDESITGSGQFVVKIESEMARMRDKLNVVDSLGRFKFYYAKYWKLVIDPKYTIFRTWLFVKELIIKS